MRDSVAATLDRPGRRRVAAKTIASAKGCGGATVTGDASAAAVGTGLAEGMSIDRALELACAAGAPAASRHGAPPAMPSRHGVNAWLAARSD